LLKAQQMVHDPVCGMRVPRHSENRVRHHGHEYLFCSEHCIEKFRANPAAYEGKDVPEALAHASA